MTAGMTVAGVGAVGLIRQLIFGPENTASWSKKLIFVFPRRGSHRSHVSPRSGGGGHIEGNTRQNLGSKARPDL
jgi:hypothetical protein